MERLTPPTSPPLAPQFSIGQWIPWLGRALGAVLVAAAVLKTAHATAAKDQDPPLPLASATHWVTDSPGGGRITGPRHRRFEISDANAFRDKWKALWSQRNQERIPALPGVDFHRYRVIGVEATYLDFSHILSLWAEPGDAGYELVIYDRALSGKDCLTLPALSRSWSLLAVPIAYGPMINRPIAEQVRRSSVHCSR